MTQATDSQFAMWRGAIALAWADGRLDAGEKAKLSAYFKDNIYLSDAQRAMLAGDLERGGTQMKDIWPAITDKEDRAHLLDIAADIFWADGDYSPTEHELYDKMFADQMASIDIRKIKKEIHEAASHIPEQLQKDEQMYEAEMDRAGPLMSAAGRLIYHFEKRLGLE